MPIGQYFALNYSGSAFAILGPAHIVALSSIILLNLSFLQFRRAGERIRDTVRITLAVVLWLAELSWHVWNALVGTWTVQTMLPLNLCSILIWLTGLMLIFKNHWIYEFAYFLGIGGGIQYLATPDLGIYGFPHFRFFQTFISHGLLVTAPIYMTIVEGFRPSWKSVLRVTLFANVYMGIIYLVNSAIGSDYLNLNAKPATPSLLDLLPPWPYYITFMELIGIATILILYLPFFIGDLRANRWPAGEKSAATDNPKK
jgi:hypothetical integral membrane protein (TIGR02206 family)